MRLTKKIKVIAGASIKGIEDAREVIAISDKKLAEEKLFALEDIEDELGIDLITLFKALKNRCYGIQNGKIYKMNIIRLDNQDKENIILFRNKHYGGECYLLKDYGKTWALTKEELE